MCVIACVCYCLCVILRVCRYCLCVCYCLYMLLPVCVIACVSIDVSPYRYTHIELHKDMYEIKFNSNGCAHHQVKHVGLTGMFVHISKCAYRHVIFQCARYLGISRQLSCSIQCTCSAHAVHIQCTCQYVDCAFCETCFSYMNKTTHRRAHKHTAIFPSLSFCGAFACRELLFHTHFLKLCDYP